MKAKFTLLLAILFFTIANTSFAQWTQVGYMIANTDDTIPGSRTHNNILGFGSNIYCCTDSGLFASSNNGDTWQNLTDDQPVVDDEKIFGFFVAGNGDMYLGSHRRLYKSDNNGASWTWLNTLPDDLLYNGIDEIGGNIVVSYQISYTNGGVYYSGNNGTSWTLATGLPDLPMFYFQAVGNKIYLAGKDGIYASTDNGQSWVVSGTGQPTGCRYYDVDESGGNLFGGDVNGLGMWASYDDGATWINPYPTVFTGFCQVFSITASDDMVVAAMDGSTCSSGGTGVKMSNDDGQTWNTFMTGLEAGFYATLGKNADETSFFAKRGSNGKKVYRYDLVTGIESINNAAVKVTAFPNPFSDHTTINIEGVKAISCNFILYDVVGKVVENRRINSKTFVIENTGLNKGVYFYHLVTENKIIATGKLVIE